MTMYCVCCIDNNVLRLQEKRSVKSITSDKLKNEKDSEMGKVLEEERKKNAELQREIELQVKSLSVFNK